MNVNVGLAPTPTGPDGSRASIFNGLADSIWSGSKKKNAAATWVEYLTSPACQDVAGQQEVVFPAIASGTRNAQATFAGRDIDVKSFTQHVEDKSPVPDFGQRCEIATIMPPAVDAVLEGQADPLSLTAANAQVNALFK